MSRKQWVVARDFSGLLIIFNETATQCLKDPVTDPVTDPVKWWPSPQRLKYPVKDPVKR